MALALGLGACRDLVRPRIPGSNGGTSVVRMQLVGLDGILDRSRVTIDDTPYVAPGEGRQWEAESYLNEVVIEGAPAGTYDVTVRPDYQMDTPAWTERAVELSELPTTISYDGVAVVVDVDWPGLSRVGLARDDLRFAFSYLMPDPRDPARMMVGEISFGQASDGVFRGRLPWRGNFQLDVEADEGNTRLRYTFPDSVAVDGAGTIRVDPILREQSMTLLAGGVPLTTGSVHLRLVRSEYQYRQYYELSYDFRQDAAPDTVYLLPPLESNLRVTDIDGPLFPNRLIHLTADRMDPGEVELGRHELTLLVGDPGSAPLAEAAVAIDEETDGHWRTDAAGRLSLRLDPGPHLLEIVAPGYRADRRVVELSGDLVVPVLLEQE